MPYLVKKAVTAMNVNGDTFVHSEGTVLSDWELSDNIRAGIAAGSSWFRDLYEPLLDREAHHYRVEATKNEGSRDIEEQTIQPPFDDYIGLHPAEIIDRMKNVTLDKARQIKLYEKAGMNRQQIVAHVAPSEREPFDRYDALGPMEIIEKFSVLSDPQIADAKIYEANHASRDIILSYDKEIYERPASTDGTKGLPVEPQPPVPTQPLSPAPPMAPEGATPSTAQHAAAQQPVAPPPPPAPVAPIGAPPAG